MLKGETLLYSNIGIFRFKDIIIYSSVNGMYQLTIESESIDMDRLRVTHPELVDETKVYVQIETRECWRGEEHTL